VTVENVSLKKGYFRGAVEVSDGSDNVAVRHVYAEEAVYAADVQDHGAVQKGKMERSAPNTNVTLEDVTAVGCKHVIRTANNPLGHANLTLRDFTARNCQIPVQISNTTHVRLENLTVINEPAAETSRINLRNCDDVVFRNVTIKGLKEEVNAVRAEGSTNVKIERLTADARP
jgi:polygalacturonase